MNAQDIVDRLTLARDRIDAEIMSVKEDIGPEWEVRISNSFVPFSLDGDSTKPTIELEATLRSES